MKIVFDNIIFSLQESGGGSVYWAELIKRFCEINENNTFVEYKKREKNILRKTINLEKDVVIESKWPLPLIRFLPLLMPIKEKSIFHSSCYRYSNSLNAINVLTIYDFTAELFMNGMRRNINYFQKRQAIKRADGIICISNHTKSDLLKLHSWVNESKIKVIYIGVSSKFFPLIKSDNNILPEGLNTRTYVLYVGHRTKQYKNFDLALKTLHKLPDDFFLVVAGEPFNKEELKLIQSEELLKRVIIIVKPNVNELNTLYNYAYCFLYPSSYEGFGIPVIEAMRTGCPVVAVNKSSIPEVAGNAALLVDNACPELFANAIMNIDNQKDEIIKKGFEQAKKFSWDKCFQEVYDFYNELYENN
jgi:mannosyltransferase